MYKNIDLTEMRILPVNIPSELEGLSIHDVQQEFFLKDLINHNGEYQCQIDDVYIHDNALVLFQYSNSIVAIAVLDKVVESESVRSDYGKYCFNINSIAIFNPITSVEMKKLFRINKLSMAKQRLELSKKKTLLDVLSKKGITYCNSTIA
jgi:hypothetical protein